MYELLFSSLRPKAKNFRKHGCNVKFPYIRQQLSDKMVVDLRYEHEQAITDQDNRIQANQHENVALHPQRDVYQAQLQKCEDTITHLTVRYVGHARDPGKNNIVIIVRKHTTSTNNKYHDLSYYASRTQRRKRYVKLIWLN